MTESGTPPRARSSAAAALAIIAIFVVGFAATVYMAVYLREGISAPRPALATLPEIGPITIALTGDTSLVPPSPASDKELNGVAAIVRQATLGITNFEPFGLAGEPRDLDDTAARLRALGVDVAALANNHAMDGGERGLDDLRRALTAAGIGFSGAGADLDAARRPMIIGSGQRSVAVISVTTSAAPEALATASRSDIRGRPGVSALRYTAAITVDAATFRTLAASIAALNAGPPPGDRELTMFGTRVERGDRTEVRFVVNADDRAAILESVRAARAASGVVIVSLHSHEPSNASDEPADFVRQFARDAVDAGAQVVVGHGPHRVRGFERYGEGVIFYSLGHFTYDVEGGSLERADPFDAGSDLYRAVLRTPAGSGTPTAQLDDERWWEGLVVLLTFEETRLASVEVHPLDLGFERPFKDRGAPSLAAGGRGDAILGRFGGLSRFDQGQGAWRVDRGVLYLPISQKR